MEIKINDSVFVRLRTRWSEEGKKRGRRSYTIPVSSFKKDFQTIEKRMETDRVSCDEQHE